MELNLVTFDHVITSFFEVDCAKYKSFLRYLLVGGYKVDCLDHIMYICAYGNPLAIIELYPIHEKVATDIFIGR